MGLLQKVFKPNTVICLLILYPTVVLYFILVVTLMAEMNQSSLTHHDFSLVLAFDSTPVQTCELWLLFACVDVTTTKTVIFILRKDL